MKQDLIWTTQPIFISSTFSDMNAERDVLRNFVFKEMEEKPREIHGRLDSIDLMRG